MRLQSLPEVCSSTQARILYSAPYRHRTHGRRGRSTRRSRVPARGTALGVHHTFVHTDSFAVVCPVASLAPFRAIGCARGIVCLIGSHCVDRSRSTTPRNRASSFRRDTRRTSPTKTTDGDGQRTSSQAPRPTARRMVRCVHVATASRIAVVSSALQRWHVRLDTADSA